MCTFCFWVFACFFELLNSGNDVSINSTNETWVFNAFFMITKDINNDSPIEHSGSFIKYLFEDLTIVETQEMIDEIIDSLHLEFLKRDGETIQSAIRSDDIQSLVVEHEYFFFDEQ